MNRGMLVGAAAYNTAWGVTAIVAPSNLARVLGFERSGDGMGWRAAGVVVLAYAPAYLWAVGHPREARPILATALFGKALGILGWLAGAATRRFSPRTALLPLLNDAIWIPSLILLLRESGEGPGVAS